MARPGVSYLDVAKTAIKLTEQKIYPTIEEIRKSLGTGSNSTINKHLREWRSKHGNQAELEQGLPESLLMAVRGIYDGITETATSKINFIENESKNAISELKTKLIAVETNHTKLLQENKSFEHTIQEHREENLSLQRQLNKLQTELDKKTEASKLLQERLDDKKSEVENFNSQLKNAQNNLEHYRETMRQTRETENNLLNDKIKILEKQLHQKQIISSKSTEKMSDLSRQIKSINATKELISQDLNEKSTVLNEQKYFIQHQTTIHNELCEKYNNLQADRLKIDNELKTEKAAIISLRIHLEKAQERVMMLECSLEKAENKIAIVSDKNLFLTQEKTELSVQMKQMQASGR